MAAVRGAQSRDIYCDEDVGLFPEPTDTRRCLCWREGLMSAEQLEEEVDDDQSRSGWCVDLGTLLWLPPSEYLCKYNTFPVSICTVRDDRFS